MVIIKILLLDQHEKYIRNLKDVIDFKHTEEINGENISDLILSGNQDIQKDYRTLYKDDFGYWHEFIVKGIDEIKDSTGIIKDVFSESSFYETLGDYIEEKAPQGSANHALQVALEPTRWQVGFVDDLGINRTHFYNISAKEAVEKVAEVWGGEIRTRVEVEGNVITGRYVDLFQRRGSNNGKRFTYKKDISSIERTIHRDDVITALYGFGKGEEVGDGFGRRINFADINNGKKYLENNVARQRWGRLDADGNRVHVFGKKEYDDIEDKEILKDETQKDLDILSEPRISYNANVIDLKAYGYEHEGTQLGDYVLVIDKDFDPEIRVVARVVKLIRSPKKPEETNITIGNFIDDITKIWNEQEDILNNFRGKQGIWDRSENLNPDGTVDANRINNIIKELNDQINADGGYVYFDDEGDGMITFDKPRDQDPSKVIQIKGGSLRIANSKKSNGEWDWRTVATGDGFTADAIIAGNLELTRGLKITKDGKPILSVDSSGKVIFDVAGVVKEKELQAAKEELENLINDIELTPGEDGKTAYEIAVEQGFEGSEQDWLDSLKAESGSATYTWIKYADDDQGSGMSDSDEGKKYIGMAFNKETPTGSDVASDYIWSLMPQHIETDSRNIIPTNRMYWEQGHYDAQGLPIDHETTLRLSSDFWIEIKEDTEYLYQDYANNVKVTIFEYNDAKNYIKDSGWISGSNYRFRTDSATKFIKLSLRFSDTTENRIENMDLVRIKIEKGIRPTDWTPSIEDIQAEIEGKATAEKVDEVEQNLIDIAESKADGQLVTDLETDLRDYLARLEQEEKDTKKIEGELKDLFGKYSIVDANLGNLSATASFVDTYMKVADEGFFIGSENKNSGVLISPERIDFFNGGESVANLSQGTLHFNSGIFVENLRIGEHRFKKEPNGQTVIGWTK